MKNQHSFSATNQPQFGRQRRRHGGTLRTLCPHCDHPAHVRTSKILTRTFKELRFQCSNVESDPPCGFAFVASLNIDRTIVPSARPRLGLSIPMQSVTAGKPANDDEADPEAATIIT